MTDTLLCIGGPCDGKRPATVVDGSQTLILYVRPKMPFPPRLGEIVPDTVCEARAIYSREAIHFGGGVSVDLWVHESLSPRDALLRLIERYKGDAK